MRTPDVAPPDSGSSREPTEQELAEAIARKRAQLREAGVMGSPGERQMRNLEPAVDREEIKRMWLARTEPGPACRLCSGPTSITHYAAPRAIGGEIAERVCDDPACEEERRREAEYDEWARERNEARLARLRRKSELPCGFERLTFDRYNPAGNPSLAAALESARGYARTLDLSASDGGASGADPGSKKVDQGPSGILFEGPVGVGKSHLAAAILEHAIRVHKIPAMFATVPRMLEKERDRYGGDARPYGPGPCEEAARADLLVLDDLGAEKTTEWAREKMFMLINHRYIHGMPTVATTNLAPGQVAGVLGTRTFSRLVEMCEWVTVSGEDRRLERLTSRWRETGEGR